MATYNQVLKSGRKGRRSRGNKKLGSPQRRGVCVKVGTKSPKKPNSANRAFVKLRISNGKTRDVSVTGEGHQLQEHNSVLVRGGRVKDLPGVSTRAIRGALDLRGVRGRISSRSKYGVRKPKLI